jgi:hypothetical protein
VHLASIDCCFTNISTLLLMLVNAVWVLLMFASVSDLNLKVATDSAVMDIVRYQTHLYAQLIHAVSCVSNLKLNSVEFTS